MQGVKGEGPMEQSLSGKNDGRNLISYLVLITLLAAAVRGYIWFMSPVVNPDGVLYIHQARAFYHGQWEDLTNCSLSFFSIYPLLVALIYPFFHDWVSSARIISILFGSLTVAPVYLMARRFASSEAAILTSVLFAVLPGASGAAGQIVRDLVCWFFLAWGMYLVVSQMEKPAFKASLFLSCLCFLLASWARVEAFLFIILSVVFLALRGGEGRAERILYFSLPLAITFALGILLGPLCGLDMAKAFRLREIADKILEPWGAYVGLRGELKGLSRIVEGEALRHFFSQARHNAWLLAAISLAGYVLKAFLYFYFILFAAGIWKAKEISGGIKSVVYPIMISSGALLLLYVHLIHTWVMDTRFVMIFVIPSLCFVAAGIDYTFMVLGRRLRLSFRTAFLLVLMFIILIGVWNDLRFSERDKSIFKEIGEAVAAASAPGKEALVVSSLHTVRWVSFYANMHIAGAPCPQPYSDFRAVLGKDYNEMTKNLKAMGASHLLWEERHWPQGTFDLLKNADSGHLKRLGSWYHPDTGEMILFRCVWEQM